MTDGDGDEITASLDIGGIIAFQDSGLSVNAEALSAAQTALDNSGTLRLTVDESTVDEDEESGVAGVGGAADPSSTFRATDGDRDDAVNLSALFDGVIDAETDGVGSTTYRLTLGDGESAEAGDAGVASGLSAVNVGGAPEALYLYQLDATTVVATTDAVFDADNTAYYFTITVTPDGVNEGLVTVTQDTNVGSIHLSLIHI